MHRADKKAKLSAGGYSAYRLRATSQLLPPRTRVARTLQQKTSFLLPGPRPIGRGRHAVRPHLSCVRSFHFPPLPSPTCFFASAKHNVYDIIEWRSISIATAVSQREPSADATLMLLQQNTMRLFLVFGFVECLRHKGKIFRSASLLKQKMVRSCLIWL